MKKLEPQNPGSTRLPHIMVTAPTRRQWSRLFRAFSMARVAVLMVFVASLGLPTDSQSLSEVDATRETSHHHKREHRHGDTQDLPQPHIESNARPISSQTVQWRNERKKPYGGSYLNTNWKDPSRATQNSVQKEDLAERQKRTEAEKSPSTSWQGSNHLSLKDGGYEGLVVEVSSHVPQKDCKTVIDGTQVCAWHFS